MAAIKVGIVGTGFSARAHADALRRLPEVELVGIAGRTAERARQEADRLGIPAAYGSCVELLESGVDAVHNCTPNDLHFDVSASVLRAGRHLLSEKPVALTSDESAVLVVEAARAGVAAGVCFNYRHYPLVRQAKDVLASGRLGAVHFIHGGYLQDWLLYATDWNWRLDPTRAGVSRAVADIGSHWLDLVQYVTGDAIASVFADLGTLHERRRRPASDSPTFAANDAGGEDTPVESEDFGSIMLRFASGARGALTVSQVSAGRKNRLFLELDAEAAALAWDQEEPNRLWIGRRDEANGELLRDPALLEGGAATLTRYPGGHAEGWPDALRNLCADFYAAVDAKRRRQPYEASFASLDEGHRLVELVEAVVASHRSQQWAEVRRPEGVTA